MRFVDAKIKIPIYSRNILLVVTDDIDKYVIEKELIESMDSPKAVVINCDYSADFPYSWACVFHIDKLNENIIVHETFHLTAKLLRDLDTPLIDETEEVYAYLQEYLYKVIRQRTIEIKARWNDGDKNT